MNDKHTYINNIYTRNKSIYEPTYIIELRHKSFHEFYNAVISLLGQQLKIFTHHKNLTCEFIKITNTRASSI